MPSEWLEHLFFRFEAIYGGTMSWMWGEATPTEVKAVWGEELGEFVAEDLRMALQSCRFAHKDKPPTLFQFSELCRMARDKRTSVARAVTWRPLPADAEVLAQLHQLAENMRNEKPEPRDWARRLLRRHENGETVRGLALRYAREALGFA